MRLKALSSVAFLPLFASVAFGQTTVTTTGGTTNKVPVFTGTSSIAASPISISGADVGIGITNPNALLYIEGGSGESSLSLETTSNSSFDVIRWITPSALYQAGSGGPTSGPIANDWYLFDQTNGKYRFVLTQTGNIGIGTTSPITSLDIGNGILHVAGLVSPSIASQGAYFGWNYTGGQGETDFLNNEGLGPGGWYFYNSAQSGTPVNKVFSISGTGALTFADGSKQTTAWTGVLCGGDYAESVRVDNDRRNYEPGDVLIIAAGERGDVEKSGEPYSTSVAGIYSTKPGVTGRRLTTPKTPDEVPMAMVGIVPAKVSAENGPIRRGDLLVTSSLPGYVMKGTDRERMMGAIVGKALGSLESGTGVIEVLVSLQ